MRRKASCGARCGRGLVGLEPTTSRTATGCSDQLSYRLILPDYSGAAIVLLRILAGHLSGRDFREIPQERVACRYRDLDRLVELAFLVAALRPRLLRRAADQRGLRPFDAGVRALDLGLFVIANLVPVDGSAVVNVRLALMRADATIRSLGVGVRHRHTG